METFIKPTLGWKHTVHLGNDVTIGPIEISELNKLRKLAEGKDKNHLPALYPYTGEKGKYSPSNIFIVDIDTTEGVDTVLLHTDDIISHAPNILFFQKSFSGKLHIVGLMRMCDNESDYKLRATIWSYAVAEIIRRICGIDYGHMVHIKIVKQTGGSEEEVIEPVIDANNLKFSQALFVTTNPFTINGDPKLIELTDENVEYLKKEYDIKIEPKRIYTGCVNMSLGKYIDGDASDRVIIDRNSYINGYTGNEARWRISKIAETIFGEGAKEWCDRHFITRDRKSIYSRTKDSIKVNSNVLRWLRENGYLKEITEKTTGCDLKDGEYLSKYEDEIAEFIKTHTRCAVTAPTGAGKTTLINGQITPGSEATLFDRCIKSEGVANRLNAVVIVPFNTTNRLYSNLYEVSTVKGNQNDPIPEDKACTLVIDQAYKHINELKGRYIIIDESHVLFTDRTYRESAAYLLGSLRTLDCHICCMSATFTGELDILDIKDIYTRTKERDIIDLNYIHTDPKVKDLTFMREMIDPRYDRVVLFSDSYAVKIFEWLIDKGVSPKDVTIMHSAYANLPAFTQLKETEQMDTRYVICTRLAYNGLNFKNENEKIKVITDFVPGQTLSAEVIQAIGRIRRSKIDVCVIENWRANEDVEGNIEAAKIIGDFAMVNGSKFLFEHTFNPGLLVEEVSSANREIAAYRSSHSNFDTLKEDLQNLGYVKLIETEVGEEIMDKYRLSRRMCSKASGMWISYVSENNRLPETDDDVTGRYVKEWNRKVWDMMNRGENENCNIIKGFKLSDIIKMYNSSDKQITVPTLLSNMDTYIDALSYTEDEWEKEKLVYNLFEVTFKSNITLYHRVRDRWRRMCKYREMAYALPNFKLSKYECPLDVMGDRVFDGLITEAESDKAAAQCGRVEGGKKGSPKKRVMYDGIIYDSCDDLASKLGKRRNTITNWIKNGKVQIIK